jgi:hypothetical protein
VFGIGAQASGGETLARWLRRRRAAARFIALEEALLTGRFWRYALHRLAAFGLSRTLAIFVHILELTWLFEIFSAKPFIASVALQNVTLVADAFFWGALEGLRRRVRELGPTSESAALVTRWLSLAYGVAFLALAIPIGVALGGARAEPMLHVYAAICAFRLAADVVLRTYYSGVFAHRRVHRPVWSVLVGPVLVVVITLGLWERAGGWSFVAALVVSTIVSRALLFVFTRRAYRRHRVPRPHVRLLALPALAVIDRQALLAGIANLSTRLGGVVLLAALIPSLTNVVNEDDEVTVEPFAFALHLAAPFILIASQWAFVFYHDWKRVESDESSRLGRLLERRLLVIALVVGFLCALISAALVLLYVPWEEAWPTLGSLLFATVGLSIWTSLQLRRFSHGEHARQAATALALAIVVVAVLSSESLGVEVFYPALALGPWLAIALHALLERVRRPAKSGEVTSIDSFLDSLSRSRGDVVVWEALAAARAASIAERFCAKLGPRGALVRVGNRVVWFERAPFTSRVEWLRRGAGRLASLQRHEVPASEARRLLVARAILTEPDPSNGVERLAAEHARLFPEGFVLRVGAAPPRRFLALAPAMRQAIWRDALRARAGARGRSGWFVTSLSRVGSPEAVFAAPRPIAGDQLMTWRNAMRSAEWRLGRGQGTKVSPDDDKVKLGQDPAILES